jgi:energy-coupling factor transport system ATP-binding protein
MCSLAALTDVIYRYPNRETPSLRHVSLSLEPAEFVLLLGSSGSGKSSLLRVLSGLIPHFHGGVFAGQAHVAGESVRVNTPRELSRHVGMVFQDPENQCVMSTVEREIAFGLENLGTPSRSISRLVEEALISIGLSHLRRASLRSLSGGELQKVALASVLAMQPHVLLLDEPTSQLDPISSEDLLGTLRRLLEDTGCTIVLAEHRAERCLHLATRVVFMDSGEIVHDSPPQEFCRWALDRGVEFVPPVTRLFGNSLCRRDDGGMIEVPLTVQAARRVLSETSVVAKPGSICVSPQAVEGEPLLETRGLSVGYLQDAPLLSEISLTLRAGEFVALMGENGCGKSTLIRHFIGLQKPLGGRVLLKGGNVNEMTVAAAARSCGLLGQNPNDYFVKDSVAEELAHTLHHLGYTGREQKELIQQTVKELQLDHILDRHPRELSGGERSRAALATVSVARPPLMVLDEPTRGIDPPSKAGLGRILTQWTEAGRCVLLVTHDVEFAARYARRVILLGDGGILADGNPRDILDGALYFSTQVNRLLRHLIPGVLVESDVEVRPR